MTPSTTTAASPVTPASRRPPATPPGGGRRPWAVALAAAMLAVAAGCGPKMTDPLGELRTTAKPSHRHLQAMEMLDQAPGDQAYLKQLHRLIWVAGYSVGIREQALERLERHDLDGLKRTISQQLPLLPNGDWADRLCQIIAERQWTDLTETLVNRWTYPIRGRPDLQRPEFTALAGFFGPGNVEEVVFEVMLDAKQAWRSGLRTRCWALLQRLGARDRLVQLIESTEVAPDDAMFIDLRASARDLGLIPHNREEILWIRKLREPSRAAFWSEAAAAVGQLPPDKRRELEVRDLPVVVSAARHAPDLLAADREAVIAQLAARLDGRRRYTTRSSGFDAGIGGDTQRLAEVRNELTWGDAAAMLIALQALEVPQVVDHLFDFADRDQDDRSTEYGGVIRLDDRGRFEILEFVPRIRQHDQRFNASQEMFDAGYAAIFHFHFHVQRDRNHDYAGPGFGDRQYAESTRANCLVLTSVGGSTLNVDYYRHGGVVVDLGVIERPGRPLSQSDGRPASVASE